MNWDPGYVALLLTVAKESREYPKLKAIHDEAISELEAIAAGESTQTSTDEEAEGHE